MICLMSGSLKRQSGFSEIIIAVANKPRRFLTRLKYRVQGLAYTDAKAPDAITNGLSPDDENFKNLSFTFSIIALSAKIACADGNLTQDKYIAFRDSFPIKDGVCEKLRSLFTLACHNETPLEHYVTQIKFVFPANMSLFKGLVERLFVIASADGAVSAQAEKMLSTIAHMLHIRASDFAQMCALYETPSSSASTKQAMQIMGVDANAKSGTLKKRYHELMQQYHPDRFAGVDLSPEVKQLLQFKASEINDAYRSLKKQAA